VKLRRIVEKIGFTAHLPISGQFSRVLSVQNNRNVGGTLSSANSLPLAMETARYFLRTRCFRRRRSPRQAENHAMSGGSGMLAPSAEFFAPRDSPACLNGKDAVTWGFACSPIDEATVWETRARRKRPTAPWLTHGLR